MSFDFLFRSIVIGLVVHITIVWAMYLVFLCQGFDDMTLSISYGFYMKVILKDDSNVVKSFNSALLFIYVYVMNDTKRLVKDLREVKYASS